MVCLRAYALLGIAGYAGPDGGLRAMGRSRGGVARRNAGRHRRPQAQPGLRAAGSCWSMGTAAASAGAAGPSEGLRAGWSSGRTKPEYTTASGRRDLRERADMSVRRPGLGARLLATSDEARAVYDLQLRQRFFLPDNQRATVLGWKGFEPLALLS